jgi:hypothetical protein
VSYADKAGSSLQSTACNKLKTHKEYPDSKTTFSKGEKPSREDIRVLVTVPTEVLLAGRGEPFLLRKKLVGLINGLTMASIPVISPTKSGWAIVPADLAARDILLGEGSRGAILETLQGNSVATPEVWHNYVVPLIPSAFRGLTGDGTVLVDETLVHKEVLTQTGISPVRVEPSKQGVDPITGKQSWIVSFTKTVAPFHLFNSDSRARVIARRAALTIHLHGCQGWCNPVKCTRTKRCNHCGCTEERHEGPTGANCIHEVRCANCLGPFVAGHTNCPAMPVRQGERAIPCTKKELKSIRTAGLRAIRAARESVSPEFFTPDSSSKEASVNGLDAPDKSPSSSPTQINGKRLRGEAVTRHENASIAPNSRSFSQDTSAPLEEEQSSENDTPASSRLPRVSASTPGSLDARVLTAIQSNRALPKDRRNANKFESLQVTSAQGLSDDDMEDTDT